MLHVDSEPREEVVGPPRELSRQRARGLITKAAETELAGSPDQFRDAYLEDRRRMVVRNGDRPERNLQTGIVDVAIRAPRCATAAAGVDALDANCCRRT